MGCMYLLTCYTCGWVLVGPVRPLERTSSSVRRFLVHLHSPPKVGRRRRFSMVPVGHVLTALYSGLSRISSGSLFHFWMTLWQKKLFRRSSRGLAAFSFSLPCWPLVTRRISKISSHCLFINIIHPVENFVGLYQVSLISPLFNSASLSL